MKLAYFNDYRIGVVTGDTVIDVNAIVQEIPHVRAEDLMA